MTLSTPKFRVLLVDDTTGFSSLFDEWLKDPELDVHVASSGAEALRRLCASTYDLAFIDVHLDDMGSAMGAVEVVRLATEAGCALPRLFAITGDGRQETREACLDAGFIEVLVKPLLRSRFVELVEVEKLRRAVFG